MFQGVKCSTCIRIFPLGRKYTFRMTSIIYIVFHTLPNLKIRTRRSTLYRDLPRKRNSNLIFSELFVDIFSEICERPWSDSGALERYYFVVYCDQHTLDLMIFTFDEDELEMMAIYHLGLCG